MFYKNHFQLSRLQRRSCCRQRTLHLTALLLGNQFLFSLSVGYNSPIKWFPKNLQHVPVCLCLYWCWHAGRRLPAAATPSPRLTAGAPGQRLSCWVRFCWSKQLWAQIKFQPTQVTLFFDFFSPQRSEFFRITVALLDRQHVQITHTEKFWIAHRYKGNSCWFVVDCNLSQDPNAESTGHSNQ